MVHLKNIKKHTHTLTQNMNKLCNARTMCLLDSDASSSHINASSQWACIMDGTYNDMTSRERETRKQNKNQNVHNTYNIAGNYYRLCRSQHNNNHQKQQQQQQNTSTEINWKKNSLSLALAFHSSASLCLSLDAFVPFKNKALPRHRDFYWHKRFDYMAI